MTLSGWGNFPKVEGNQLVFEGHDALREIVRTHDELIAAGNGRSYGDSALARTVVDMRPRNLFLDFDSDTGLLHVESGVLLS